MNKEDMKDQLKDLADLLCTTYEMEERQRCLVTELVILKMKLMIGEICEAN